MASAIVLSASGGVYDVELDDRTVTEASLRGRLKLVRRTGDGVVAGDRVTLAQQSDGSFTIESVVPRNSELARRAPGHGRRAKVMVANVERMVIVFAARQPEPKRRLLDRFLVLAEANQLGALIVLNKIDQVDDDAATAFLAPYETAGYDTLRTSVTSDIGIADLRDRVCGANSVIAGPSGVGKSSLLNSVQPGLGLRVGALSTAIPKGQHTTVGSRLIPLECGGYIADTPGLRELGLWGIGADELADHFPEFTEHRTCRFSRSCSHTHEPGCGVREAVAAGQIDRERYDSYCLLRDEAIQADG